MQTRSIFVNNNYSKATDQVAVLAVELDTCERLIGMGYKFSNNQNLAQRANYLEKEITRLEELRKQNRWFMA